LLPCRHRALLHCASARFVYFACYIDLPPRSFPTPSLFPITRCSDHVVITTHHSTPYLVALRKFPLVNLHITAFLLLLHIPHLTFIVYTAHTPLILVATHSPLCVHALAHRCASMNARANAPPRRDRFALVALPAAALVARTAGTRCMTRVCTGYSLPRDVRHSRVLALDCAYHSA